MQARRAQAPASPRLAESPPSPSLLVGSNVERRHRLPQSRFGRRGNERAGPKLRPDTRSGHELRPDARSGHELHPDATISGCSLTLPPLPPLSGCSFEEAFATATIGEVPDTVYGLTLCRGDADSSSCSCRACVSTVFYGSYLVRYSDQNFLSISFSSRRIRRRASPPPPTSLSQRRPFATRTRPRGDDDASIPLSSGYWAGTAC